MVRSLQRDLRLKGVLGVYQHPCIFKLFGTKYPIVDRDLKDL